MPEEKVIGIIPAAGKGSRLGLPFPKELYPIIVENNYKPVSNFIVDSLLVAGVKHIVFIINQDKHEILGYFGNGKRFGCNISYVVQEDQPNLLSTSPGLANALAESYHLIQGKIVLFGMPDTIMKPSDAFEIGLKSLDDKTDIILCLFPTNYPEKFGMVSYNEDLYVKEIVDKPQSTNLKYMWGCIIWKPIFTEFLNEKVKNNFDDFAQIINLAIENEIKVKAVKFEEGRFIDFGTYEQIQEYISDQDRFF